MLIATGYQNDVKPMVQIKRHHCVWTVLNSVISNNKTQVKPVAVCKKVKVLKNATKQQNQRTFCLL